MSRQIVALFHVLGDRKKIAVAQGLTPAEMDAVLSPRLTNEQLALLEFSPERYSHLPSDHPDILQAREHAKQLHILRVIYYRHLTDWNTKSEIQNRNIFDQFIQQDGFQQWDQVTAAIANGTFKTKVEMSNHARKLDPNSTFMRSNHDGLDMRIWGVAPDSNVPWYNALVSHNQVIYYGNSSTESHYSTIDSKYGLPQVFTTARLLSDPYSLGADLSRASYYLSMKSPIPSRHGSTEQIELYLPESADLHRLDPQFAYGQP